MRWARGLGRELDVLTDACLVDRIGLPRAKEMWLTARHIDAATACRWGLVNDVVPADELTHAVVERAAAIAAHDQGNQATLGQHFVAEAAAARAAGDYQGIARPTCHLAHGRIFRHLQGRTHDWVSHWSSPRRAGTAV